MKKIGVLLIGIFMSLSLFAQKDEISSRKGKILIETGQSTIIDIQNGTGSSILFSEGDNVFTLGANGGYFITNNFAIKVGLGIYASGSTLTSITVGGKYYIAGKIPIELGIGSLIDEEESLLQTSASIGYAFRLADNINLEPTFGMLILDGESATKIGVNFALFF